MLITYQEIRDRIYKLARERDLRVDWISSSRTHRELVLYDAGQVPVARATVPLRYFSQDRLGRLASSLEGVFGERWMG